MFKTSKQQIILFTLLAIFAINVSAFSLQYLGNMKHPDLPDHCYYDEYDISIPVNKTVYPTNMESQCFKVFCREDFVLQIKHCDRIFTNRNCEETPYDFNKPYPNCCPKVTCTNNMIMKTME